MILIAAKMPEYCALVGLAIALICSLIAGVPMLNCLLRVLGTVILFGLLGMALGILMGAVLREERPGRPPK